MDDYKICEKYNFTIEEVNNLLKESNKKIKEIRIVKDDFLDLEHEEKVKYIREDCYYLFDMYISDKVIDDFANVMWEDNKNIHYKKYQKRELTYNLIIIMADILKISKTEAIKTILINRGNDVYKDFLIEVAIDYEVDNIQNEIKDTNMAFNRVKEEYLNVLKKVEKLKMINLNDEKEKLKKSFVKEINLIEGMKNVNKVNINKSFFEVEFKDIICYEPENDRYYVMPDMVCIIYTSNKNLKVFPIDKEDENCRSGYWVEKQCHPHVDDAGDPCYGSIATQIAQYFEDREYFAIAMTMLNYLKTCNIYDSAGKYIYNWDEIDINTNKIKATRRCEMCDEIIEGEEYFIDNMHICENCLEANYVFDEIDEEYIDKDNAIYVEDKRCYTHYSNTVTSDLTGFSYYVNGDRCIEYKPGHYAETEDVAECETCKAINIKTDMLEDNGKYYCSTECYNEITMCE